MLLRTAGSSSTTSTFCDAVMAFSFWNTLWCCDCLFEWFDRWSSSRAGVACCIRFFRQAPQRPTFARHDAVGDIDHVARAHRLGEVVVSSEPYGLLDAGHGRIAGDDHH